MKRKTNTKTKTKARKAIQPSQRWLRQKVLKEQREQSAGSVEAADAIGKVVTRYELDGVALFTVLPSQLERMHPDDMEDLFDIAEERNWRLTLQSDSACYVLNFCPKELERALFQHGLSAAVDKARAKAKDAAADPSAPTDDDPASPT